MTLPMATAINGDRADQPTALDVGQPSAGHHPMAPGVAVTIV